MAGFFIDKKEVTHVGLEGMSREQLEKRLSELEGKIGEAKNIIDVTPNRNYLNEGNFMTVFNEIHNNHLQFLCWYCFCS